jgi:predicted ester cyclase
MDASPAEIADAYVRWVEHGDLTIKDLCSPQFHDNVSGFGPEVFDVVGRWFDESFADRTVEHHATMSDGDRVIVWFTVRGVHVGNGFPRMRDLPVNGADVVWPQVHILRSEGGRLVEHWAVRDDLVMLESTQQA